MRLVPNWRKAWRMFSMQAMGYGLTFLAWWQTDFAPDLKARITTDGALMILAAFFAAGMVGRLIDQPKAGRGKHHG